MLSEAVNNIELWLSVSESHHWDNTMQQVVAYRGLAARVHTTAAAASCQAKQGAHA